MNVIEEAVNMGKTLYFTGESMGRKCNFPVRIVKKHPSIDGYYQVSALFADNVWFEPDWAHARDLEVR